MALPRRRSLRWMLTVAGVVAGAVGWSTLLWPPVKYFYSQPTATFWSTLSDLATLPAGTIFPEGFGIGYLFIFSTLLLIFAVPLVSVRLLSALLRYVERSEVDVSLLEINLAYRFEDRLHRVVATREQLLHANRPGLTAYHYLQTASAPGSAIDATTFEMTSILDGNRITDDFIIRAQPREFEAIEIFKRALPTHFLATYLPDWLVLLLWNHSKILDRVIVQRNGQIEITGEHDGESATIELRSLKRVAKRVTISLDFPHDVAPRQEDMRCFVIRDNVVASIYPQCHTAGPRRIYEAYVAELEGATMRFQWNNRRLHDRPPSAQIDAASADPNAPVESASWWKRKLLSILPAGFDRTGTSI
jgi:hypothetical protein